MKMFEDGIFIASTLVSTSHETFVEKNRQFWVAIVESVIAERKIA